MQDGLAGQLAHQLQHYTYQPTSGMVYLIPLPVEGGGSVCRPAYT